MNRESKAKVKLRKFRIGDYDTLIELWEKSRLPYKPKGRDRRDKIERELQAGKALFYVAECDGQIVGSIFGTHDGRKGWINRLAVHPEYRGRGIARKLVTRVEEDLNKLGIDIIACLVEGWNHDSINAFKAMGYSEFEDIVYFTKRKYPDV
ncbi:MAG: GNAT family N-acetyltransferase [FCB group bacterium]|nr:GNAT family N-acetyltransferase [FCB group bacterium]